MKIKKILIANRGEIAARIHKTAERLGIRTVAVYSESDKHSKHTRIADESFPIGSDVLSDSYLNIKKIIKAAIETGCDAIHPGYGFLAENPVFPEACKKAGLIFIGPDSEAISKMGNKTEARKIAKTVGLPMTEAVAGTTTNLMNAVNILDFPLLIKAAAGGGGKGMRIVRKKEDLKEAIETTQREAKNYFDNDEIFIEKYIENPRHIEIQVLCDTHGNAVYLFERECSLQRRHQKIVEEAPSPSINPATREKMGEAAVALCKKINYTNAGTVEFLVDQELNFYFLEMNTRIQVEHPVTELITGVDIVEQQILIAEGKKLSFEQNDMSINGHALECRIYAEDPAHNFTPSPGKIILYKEPHNEGVRTDSGIESEEEITGFFDPMISKLIVHTETREKTRDLMIKALNNYAILGIETNIQYLKALMQDSNFITNNISTSYCDFATPEIIERNLNEKVLYGIDLPALAYFTKKIMQKEKKSSVWGQIGYWRMNKEIKCTIEGRERRTEFTKKGEDNILFDMDSMIYNVFVTENDKTLSLFINDKLYRFYISDCGKSTVIVYHSGYMFNIKNENGICSDEAFNTTELNSDGSGNLIISPMHGKIIKVNVKEGDTIMKDDTLLIIEAMKMENSIKSPKDAVVKRIFANTEDKVETGKLLLEFED